MGHNWRKICPCTLLYAPLPYVPASASITPIRTLQDTRSRHNEISDSEYHPVTSNGFYGTSNTSPPQSETSSRKLHPDHTDWIDTCRYTQSAREDWKGMRI